MLGPRESFHTLLAVDLFCYIWKSKAYWGWHIWTREAALAASGPDGMSTFFSWLKRLQHVLKKGPKLATLFSKIHYLDLRS